jgi:hypothetical protein
MFDVKPSQADVEIEPNHLILALGEEQKAMSYQPIEKLRDHRQHADGCLGRNERVN